MTYDVSLCGSVRRTLPLTWSQRLRLLWGACRVLLVLAPFVFYLLFLTPVVGRPVLWFYVLMAAVVALVGFESLRNLRDLQAGVVEVREDIVLRSRASRGPGRHFRGELRSLGRVAMTSKAHFGARHGAVHRVTYSPISRFVWTAEPKTPYSS